MHALFLALLLAPAWQHGFEAGAETARSYHAEGTQPRLTYPTEGAAEGVRYLRAELPGERKLEGFRVEAAGLPGGRRATVTARVRGQGELWLCLYSRNGWLYAPQTTPLGATWTEVSLTKVLAAA
ncbi:MAG: hypothetical protein HUU35_12515, partial [Armatimonadetes bacterium]|nr:hypothetical protein [Armatimonadota bacterium]